MFDRRYVDPVSSGGGAQAQLWKTYDSITGLPCLIKAGPQVHAEALLTLDLNHPFVVTPFDAGMHEQFGEYAVYPEVRDKPLSQALHPRSSQDDRVRITLQLLEFLSFLHNRGWLYHDFKPEHFLINDQHIRVVDFGLCEKLNGQKVSTRFSGTFPFISPERITGKPYDHRSDLFALGMMMLRCLLPQENWDLPPSIDSLMKLQESCQKLKKPWAKILSELTSIEPSQRPPTAEEVWTKLLPSKARRSFLFFPIPGYFQLTEALERSARVLRVCSPSRVNLQEAEKQILRHAWTTFTRSIVVDYPADSGESILHGVCAALTGNPLNEFYEALESVSSHTSSSNVCVIFRCGNQLRSRDRANLNLFLSYLSRASWARAFVLLPGFPGPNLEEDWETIHIPFLSPTVLQERADAILPTTSPARIRSLLKRPFQMPEELIDYLRMELPDEPSYARPAASHQTSKLPNFFNLDSACRKALVTLAITGGTAPLWLIEKSSYKKKGGDENPVSRLIDLGYVTQQSNHVCLAVTPQSILCRFRANHLRQISSRLLTRLTLKKDFVLLYYVASNADDDKTASRAALKVAKAASKSNQTSTAEQWLWRAFKHGAPLQRKTLFKMARSFLRHAEFRKAQRLIEFYGRRFGPSLLYFDLKLDFYHRRHYVNDGVKTASAGMEWALRNNKKKAAEYFKARKAEFLIFTQKLDEAEAILMDLVLREKEFGAQTQGLIHHCLGLLYFYRGQLTDSVKSLKRSVRIRHRLRPGSVMNLGTSYANLKDTANAEKWLRRAIAISRKRHDAKNLGHAFNNLGIVFKLTGRLALARESYFNSVYLAQACRNPHMIIPALNNLATLAENEGRTSYAVAYRKKAIRYARKAGLKQYIAVTLMNIGKMYAVLGSRASALHTIREAIKIRSEAGLEGGLADSYEGLALVYLYDRKFTLAIKNFQHSMQLFAQKKRDRDVIRIRLYLAIVHCEIGVTPDFAQLQLEPDMTFEYGLYRFATALAGLKQLSPKNNNSIEAAHEAERIFRRLPNLFWLARILEIKAELLHQNDNYERALVNLQAALNIYSRIGARRELIRFGKHKENMKLQSELLDKIAEKLPYRLLRSIREILATESLDKMISRILSLSMEFTGMERAVLVLHENPFRIYKSTSLEEAEVHEICEISLSAVQSTVTTQTPFVCLDAIGNPAFQSKPSIIANRINSIVCLPLRVNERTLGVLYLDSKEGVETLASTETVLLEIFGSIVALAMNGALSLERMVEENTALKKSIDWGKEYSEIIGNSPALQEVLNTVHRLTDIKLPVLITGDTGTGKELIARVLHHGSTRKNGPFVAVNCSAFSKDLLESELFGHEKGAFTGATATRSGLFEQAQDGTMFLDEIAEMPVEMQVKILRVAQDGEYRRIGGQETLRTNARLIFATNRNLEEMVKNREFRQDLYYRIRGAQIRVPPLRERRQDILLLAKSFLQDAVAELRPVSSNSKQISGFTPEAIDLMKSYEWPGNIRQLKNEIERIVALTENEWIRPCDFDPAIQVATGNDWAPNEGEELLREIEKSAIENRLKEYSWNVASAAKSLGLSRHGLYSKMKRYQIREP